MSVGAGLTVSTWDKLTRIAHFHERHRVCCNPGMVLAVLTWVFLSLVFCFCLASAAARQPALPGEFCNLRDIRPAHDADKSGGMKEAELVCCGK